MTVCTGNICRSPMAQVVLANRLAEAGLGSMVAVDSTAVTGEEIGNPIDRRARAVLLAHGYEVGRHRARRVEAQQLSRRDLILAMTFRHYTVLAALASRAGLQLGSGVLRLYRSFDPACQGEPASSLLDIDDPWYGGPADFEEVLAQLESGADGVIDWVRAELASTNET